MVMRNIYKIIIISFCIIILAFSFISFLVNLKNISINQKLQYTKTIQLMDTVKIFTNNYGIPYIKAHSDNDLFFAVGYFHAKERLWQMDLARRAGKGKLSEIFGEKTLKYDLFLRSLNLENTVRETKDVLSKKSLQILSSFSNGINFYIQENKNRLSFEFGLLSYEPEEWTVDDCIIISKMMAFELSLGFYYDIAFGEMANSFGYEKAKRLIPSYPSNSPFVLDETVKTRNYSIPENSIDTLHNDSTIVSHSFNNKFNVFSYKDLKSIFQIIYETRDFLGMNGMSVGSNSWSRNKSFNHNSPAILANDPHLPIGLSARWLPMHIQSDNLNVFGFSIPGIPLVIIGRNDNVAWGITNVMLDDVDFFVEKIDDSGKYYYSNDTLKKEIAYVLDTIYIRGKEEYVYYQKYTERGQIISDSHIFYQENNTKNKYLDKFSLTFRWIGNVANDDFINMYNINKAKNWDEFTEALNLWSAPALNFTYADKQGNIGIAPSGFIPIRDVNCNPNFPNNAFESKTGWLGIAKGGVFGKLYNPQKRFVASANNKTADGIPYHITSFWEPPSRIERIEELLLISDEYTVRDAQYMQIDYYSMYAKQMFMYIVPVLERYNNLLDSNEKRIYNDFKKWDFVLNTESYEATIFNLFIERYLYNTFFDDLGEGYFKKYLLLSGIPLRKLIEISTDNYNAFFDDVRTSNVERRDYQIVKSFKEAIKKAKETFKSDNYKHWKWGKLHTINLKHKLSEVDFVGSVVTVGPFPIGGNSTTINNTEYKIYSDFETVIAPSVRFIADLGDDVVHFSLPGGVSGDPLSPNYSNLVQIWLNGGYIKYHFNNYYLNDLNLSVVIEPILSEN
jgi:penicillin amidase